MHISRPVMRSSSTVQVDTGGTEELADDPHALLLDDECTVLLINGKSPMNTSWVLTRRFRVPQSNPDV